jgi:site-specific DNA recombinase
MQYQAESKLRACIYVRISQDSTGEAAGVERQRQDCVRYCEERGWSVVAQLEDNDISASKYSKKKRPAYLEALNLIEHGQADALVAWHLDRLWRQPSELEHLIELAERQHVTVATLYGEADLQSGDGRFMARIMVSVAAKSSDDSSRRIKRKAEADAAAGKPPPSIKPFGYQCGYKAINEPEAALLREMADRMIGGQSLYDITYWLNAEGIPSPHGKLWMTRSVKRLLTRKSYAGIRDFHGAEYPGTWEPIFDPATWERLQLAIKAREGPHTGMVYSRKYLLTGLVFCGVCGRALIGTTRWDNKALHPDGTPVKRPAYHCRKRGYYLPEGGCGSIRRGSQALDHFVRESVLLRLDTPELGKMLSEDDDSGELSELLNSRNLQRARIDALVDDYATGLLSRAELTRAKATADAELKRLDAEVSTLTRTRVSLDPGQSIRDAWEANPNSWRRALIELVVKNITCLPTRKSTGWYKTPERNYRFNVSSVVIEWRT